MIVYDSLEEAAHHGLFNITSIANTLGESRQCVHSWYKRRSNTGFPEAAAEYRRDATRTAQLFLLSDVHKWKRTYVPNLGGRVART